MSDLDYRADLPAYSLSLAQIAGSLAAGDLASRQSRGGNIMSHDEATRIKQVEEYLETANLFLRRAHKYASTRPTFEGLTAAT